MDVRGLVREVVEDVDFEAQQAGKRVVIDRDCPAFAEGDLETLGGAIENVIRNVVCYTPKKRLLSDAPAGQERKSQDARKLRMLYFASTAESMSKIYPKKSKVLSMSPLPV